MGFPETFSASPHAVPSVREDKVRPRVLRGQRELGSTGDLVLLPKTRTLN